MKLKYDKCPNNNWGIPPTEEEIKTIVNSIVGKNKLPDCFPSGEKITSWTLSRDKEMVYADSTDSLGFFVTLKRKHDTDIGSICGKYSYSISKSNPEVIITTY